MSDKSGIQWTEATWNPVTGCSKVSQGCKNCYALRDWPRLSAPRPKPNAYTGRAFTDVMCHPERLDQPLRWTKPRRVFVNSMSDLFHEAVPDEFIQSVFTVMAIAWAHTFQILTKRPDRMQSLLSRWRADDMYTYWHSYSGAPREIDSWPLPNVWLGVSVEDQATADERIPLLLQTPAAVRFVSYEPALAGVEFDRIMRNDGWVVDSLRGVYSRHHDEGFDHPAAIEECGGGPRLDWVIVGGESGPKARPCVIGWVRDTVRQCKAASVAVFVKQLGALPTNREGLPHYLMDRKGGDMAEWPEDLRVREFPR